MKENTLREDIGKWLAKEGFKSGVYGWEPVLHTEGMPGGTSLMVKPNYAPEGEACTILVTPTEVIRMVIDTPFALKKWKVQYRCGYGTVTGLKDLLTDLINEDGGCWEKEEE